VTKNSTRPPRREKAVECKISNSYITPGDINTFLVSLKPREGDIHTGLPGAMGTGSPSILTDGMEDETEQINRMEPVDSTLVCNSYFHLKDYKAYFGGPE